MSEPAAPQLLLHIEDAGASSGLSLQLSWGEAGSPTSDWIQVDEPVSAEVLGRIRRYLSGASPWGRVDADETAVVEQAMVEAGQLLGLMLTSRPSSLGGFLRHAATIGLDALQVSVASTRPAFFARPWELLVLPGHTHLASAAAAAFVRTPRSASLRRPERTLACGPGAPLRVLHIATRAGPDDARAARACALSQQWEGLRWGESVELELRVDPDLPTVLGARAHVVRYDGPVAVHGGRASVRLGGAWIAAEAFAAALGSAALLVLEPTPSDEPLDAAVAELALAALRSGLAGVVADLAPRGAGGAPLDELLDFLVGGWTLRRAVVETRKRLQRRFVEGAPEGKLRGPGSVQTWAALQHYGLEDLRCTAEPVTAQDPAAAWSAVRSRLFGFPPTRAPSGRPPRTRQATAVALLGALDAEGSGVIVGPRGAGATSALHQVAAASVASDRVRCAFYWDFRVELYTLRDMAQMMAGALGHPDAAEATVASVLEGSEPYLLVLDNADRCSDEHLGLLELARQSGHRVACSARAPWGPGPVVPAVPLSDAESRMLAYELAPSSVELGRPFLAGLEAAGGNAFLVSKLATADGADQVQPLADAVREAAGAADPVAAFFAQRGEGLRAPVRRLLAAVAARPAISLGLWLVGAEGADGARTDAGAALWAALELPQKLTFREAIKAWQEAGWMTGHRLDRAALPSIDGGPELDDMIVARVLCGGLADIARQATASPESPVFGSILATRVELAGHMERLWQAGERTLATRAIARLHGIMRQAGLLEDFSGWGQLLLERTPLDAGDFEASLTWLTLANLASAPGAELSEAMGIAADALWDAVRDPERLATQRGGALFPPAAAFLQRVLDLRSDFDALGTLAELGLERAHDDGARLHWGLVRLAVALERGEGAEDAERALLDSTPDDAARGQALLQVAGMVARRGDLDGAEARVERARSLGAPTAPLEAELAFARGDTAAAARFIGLWKAALSGDASVSVDHVAARLAALQAATDPEIWAALWAEHAEGTPTPEALGVSVPISS